MEGRVTELRVSADRARPGVYHKVARGLLVVVMALGSLLLWTVIPFGWLRLAGSLSDHYTTVYVLALLGCPGAMLLWVWGLYRINRVYLRLADPTRAGDVGPSARVPGVGPDRESPLMLLEVLLIASAVAALIILVVWWLALAHSPTSTPWPDEFSGGGG